MVVNAWLILSPKADRPYLMTHPPPPEMERFEGVRVLRYELHVPEPVPVEQVLSERPVSG